MYILDFVIIINIFLIKIFIDIVINMTSVDILFDKSNIYYVYYFAYITSENQKKTIHHYWMISLI